MRALVIDAYDSFVYILYQYLLNLGVEQRVVRNDKVTFDKIDLFDPDFILLGPGPGHPVEAHYVEIIRKYGERIPILGICLGHQAIGLAFGGQVKCAAHLMHGKHSWIKHDEKGCFKSLPNPLRGTRYHSLIIEENGLPDVLQITAKSDDDGYIMGLRHISWPVESLQFHPESAYTEKGIELLGNFIKTNLRKTARKRRELQMNQVDLSFYRQQIDSLDEQIVSLLAQRTKIVQQLMVLKKDQDETSIRSCDRVRQVLEKVSRLAETYGMPPEIAVETYNALIHVLTEMQIKSLQPECR
jgi:anthranilate synthase/aminodeoxychorismate synthase-like glutamine amidotransferase